MGHGLYSEGSGGSHKRVLNRQVMHLDLCLSKVALTTVYKTRGDETWGEGKERMSARTKGKRDREKGG